MPSEKAPVTFETIHVPNKGTEKVIVFPGSVLPGYAHTRVERALHRAGYKVYVQPTLVGQTDAEAWKPVTEPQTIYVHEEAADTAEKVCVLLKLWSENGLPDDEGQAA